VISAQNFADMEILAQYQVAEDGLEAAALSFSPDGRQLAYATNFGELGIWNVESGVISYTLSTTVDDQLVSTPRLAFASPSGQYIAANGWAWLEEYGEYWNVVRHWDLLAEEISPLIFAGSSHWDKDGLAYSPDGLQLYVGAREGMGGGGSLKSYSVETGERIINEGTDDWITAIVISPDGGTVMGTSYGVVMLWDAETGNLHDSFPVTEGPLWGLSLSPIGRVLATWGGSTVYLLDRFSGQVNYQLEGVEEIVGAVFIPSGRTLISADGSTLRFWDVASYQLQTTLEMPAPILALAVSPDGRAIAVGTLDGVVYLWGVLP